MDGRGGGDHDWHVSCSALARASAFAARRNSQARQTSADRAWRSIARGYTPCREKQPGKKGAPRFRQETRRVEEQATGGRLDPEGTRLTFTAGTGSGPLR